jgi:heat shock protein HtpX
VVLIALAWLLSVVIRFALSRSREFLADAGAVELTKNPDAMIAALRKIQGRGELEDVPSAIMEMCVDNPRSGFVDLFATHPPVNDRVDALVRYAGGRDPGPIALADEQDATPQIAEDTGGEEAAAELSRDKPFLPSQPPLSPGGASGPWGPRRGG